jgi:hypothetical protein
VTAELEERVKIDEKRRPGRPIPSAGANSLLVTIEDCLDAISTKHLRLYASYAPKEDMPPSSGPGDLADAAKRLAAMRIGSGPRTGVGIEARSWASSKMGQAMRAR